MVTPSSGNGSPLDHLPEELAAQLGQDTPLEDVVAAAPYDLDARGMYTEGYLVLTADRLGHLHRDNGHWEIHWLGVGEIGEARVVDGLGMKLLRLTRDGEQLAEFRFTLRHAKSAARMHRHLERTLSDDDQAGDADEPVRPDEKKLRCDKCDRVIPAWAETCPACMNRRKILYRILDFGRPYLGRAVAAFAVALMMTAMAVAQPWLLKPLVNRGFGAAGVRPNYNVVLLFVGIMAGLMVLRLVGQVVQLRLSLGLGTLISRSIRQKIYAHMHELSLSFFATRQTGALVSRITQDTERLWQFVSSTVIQIVLAFLTLIAVGVCLFLMNWKLACFTLLPIPLMLFLMIFFHKRLRRSFRQMWFRWEQMTAVVADALPGVRVIKAFSQEQREVDRFEDRSGALFNEERRYIAGVRSVFAPLMLFCSGLGSIIVWLLGGWWLCQGQTELGTLMAFQGFLTMFLGPIREIAHMDEMFNRAATSAHRIFEVLDTEPAIFSRTSATRADAIRGRIELQNVSFSYDGIRNVLHHVTATVERGQMVGLAGPSGGGKTTLVNLICRFYDVLEGRILIDGVDVRDYDVAALRRKIGVVLQEPFLFHGTVAENIAYGKPEATTDEIITAARAANANDFILDFPDGYDTIVGERGQSLSGGERQRISIARAILNDPAVLILDEATSSVDTETEKLIQEALERLTANRTTVAIAHRLSTLRKADRLIVLDKGTVVEEGTHQELENREGGLYARLLSMQREAQATIGLAAGTEPARAEE
ncbi:MAG TPA: ABC transporter ATP-binding protein [Phycisphaerae bacterium]|nr:ABC transporter ATP-binding protein [Phycisphaerae bacterium]